MCAAKLPIDVREVMKAAADTEAARNMPISVSVYFDPQCPDDLLQVVCGAFATEARNANVRMMEYPVGAFAVAPATDLAVLVSGLAASTGQMASTIRAAGVPVLVVTNMPSIVKEQARTMGYELLDEDVVSPDPSVDGVAMPADSEFNLEPYPLTVDRNRSLLNRMGEWVVDTFREKRLAFALAFGFVRRPLPMEFVNATSVQNAGIGLVMIIPGADMPVMTLNQAKMLLQIAAAYDHGLGKERVKELAAVVGGGFACRAIARQLVSLVPGIGWVVKAGVGFAGTMAMGYAAVAYFEQLTGEGATLADALSAARAEAARVQAATSGAATPADAAAAAVRTVVADVTEGAANAAKRLLPQIGDAVTDLCDIANVNPLDMGKQVLGALSAPRNAE